MYKSINYLILFFVLFNFFNIIVLIKCSNQKINTESLLYIEIGYNITITNIFYDKRIMALRLIIINYKKKFPNISCKLLYKNYETFCNYIYKNYICKKLNNKPHGHLLVNIKTEELPNILILNNIKILVPTNLIPTIQYNLTVCITKTINYFAITRVIQTIESYRYYGVDHFVIYRTTVSNEVDKVFSFYKQKKLIDIIIWNKSLEYRMKKKAYGQNFKINDCLYKNMYKSKALIITDWDEIIVPVKHNNILEMINYVNNNKYNWFAFSSFLFHTEIYSGEFYDSNIPDTDIYSYRKYCIFRKGCVTKNLYTYLPGIYELETHFVFDGSNQLKRVYVDTDIGYIRHTRKIQKWYYQNQCRTNWMIYKNDSRENYINRRVIYILNKLKLLHKSVLKKYAK